MFPESLISRDLNEKDSINVSVRNTFLNFSDDDAWTVGANPDLRRQQTDSILHRSSNLRQEIQNAFAKGFVEESQIPDAQSTPSRLADFPNLTSQLGEFQNGSPQLREFPPVPEFNDLAMGTWKMDDSLLPEFPNHMPMPINVDQDAFPRSELEDEDIEDEDVEDQDTSERKHQDNARVTPELHAMREIAVNGGGLSGCTTVMIRYVPFKYTQRKLLREVNSVGFMGQYDFLYLPMDPRSHANRGFAFLNMSTPEAAETFYQKFHGQYLRHFSAEKPLAVLPADLQGFEENALQYAATGSHRGRRTGHTKPIFFRPLPAHIAAKIEENQAPVAPPPAQRYAAPVTNQLPDRPSNYADRNAQEMAAAMLQQALLPAMMKANWPINLQPHEMEPQAPPQAAPRFCVYCGKSRLPDHYFCPYCGNHFPK